jgi:hypothetical protein
MTTATKTKRGLQITEMDGNWVLGKFNGKPVSAKIYCAPSIFGIEKGRVSKFSYQSCSYERGWDRGEDEKETWGPVVEALEKFAQSKRFVGQWS